MTTLVKKITVITILILSISLNTNAAKIYKWIDANGETHYSATPPIQQKTKPLGNTSNNNNDVNSSDDIDLAGCEDASKKNLLVGVWVHQEDKRTRFRFYDGWIETRANGDRIPRHFIDVRKGNIQSGRWSVKGDMLKLYIDKVGKADGFLKQIKKARIHKVNKFELYLLVNDTEPMKFKRDTSSGHKPKCMRRRR